MSLSNRGKKTPQTKISVVGQPEANEHVYNVEDSPSFITYHGFKYEMTPQLISKFNPQPKQISKEQSGRTIKPCFHYINPKFPTNEVEELIPPTETIEDSDASMQIQFMPEEDFKSNTNNGRNQSIQKSSLWALANDKLSCPKNPNNVSLNNCGAESKAKKKTPKTIQELVDSKTKETTSIKFSEFRALESKNFSPKSILTSPKNSKPKHKSQEPTGKKTTFASHVMLKC